MKTGEGLLLFGGLLVGYSLLRKSAAIGTLNFYPADVKDISFDGLTPVMTLGIAVQNTSNQNFTINSFAANVSTNTYLVGNVSDFIPMQVPANAPSIIYVKVRLSILGIVNDIIRAWQTSGIKQDILLSGYVNVDNLQQPISLKYTIG